MVSASKRKISSIIARMIIDLGLIDECKKDYMNLKVIAQKLGYLIQKVGGLNMGLKFVWLTRGPYSRGLQNYYYKIQELVSKASVDDSFNEQELMAIARVEEMLNNVREIVGGLNTEVLEAVASLIMLCTDVYPPPEDPVNELVIRKKMPRDIIAKILEVVKSYGFCLQH
jgi:uncharacterized protein YwgA